MTNELLIPRITEPISAYDLLTKVCEVITEEPKRYNQYHWILRGEAIRGNHRAEPPACGTVCCVGGWIETMTERLGEDAWDIIGLPRESGQVVELFSSGALHRLTRDRPFPIEGTPEYAALGVKHIQAFQAKYADQLKAKIVEPVRRVCAERES